MAARRHIRRAAAVLAATLGAVWLAGCAAAEPPAATGTTPATRSPPLVITGQPPAAPTATAIPPTPPTAAPTPSPAPSPTAAPSPSTVASPPAVPSLSALAPIEVATSAGGRPITAHRLGSGDTAVVIVGGLHGGYEWNTILLAERLLAHLQGNPALVPAAVTLYVIPNANPDGLAAVTGFDGPFAPSDVSANSRPGRFNDNGVDLNRNWDCNWTADALWRDQPISGGAFPFSEPETRGLRDFLLALRPAVAVFLHSAANAVYVSGCPTPHAASLDLALIYGRAAGYAVEETFDHYAITGDAGDWLTTQDIPSFTVELFSHEALDWEQNLAGTLALLNYFAAD